MVHLRRTVARLGPFLSSPFALLALAGALSVAVIGLLLSIQLQTVGEREASRSSTRETRLAGNAVVAPALKPGILTGDQGAIDELDGVVRRAGLSDAFIRIKLWDRNGRILYSDEPRLIGRRYPLDPDDLDVLEHGGSESELTDLSRPENRYERGSGQIVEVYLPIKGPDMAPLLFEAYQRSASITADGRRLLERVLPSLLGGLLLLQLANFAMARWAAERVRRGDRQRAALLRRALDASDFERRRLAADLHDGVVQDLTAVSLSLSAAGRRLEERGDSGTAATLEQSAQSTRNSVRELRGMLATVYPPDLAARGLPSALRELTRIAMTQGVRADVDVDERFHQPANVEALLYRAAQEGLRNAAAHAGAQQVTVSAGTDNGRAWLQVADDGQGFDPEGRAEVGHLGLRALQDLLHDADGQLTIASSPGHGTVLRAQVPTT